MTPDEFVNLVNAMNPNRRRLLICIINRRCLTREALAAEMNYKRLAAPAYTHLRALGEMGLIAIDGTTYRAPDDVIRAVAALQRRFRAPV
jgi:hypothetical protein